jgi:pimeloyl-ACP methyl ester carboxylesterase
MNGSLGNHVRIEAPDQWGCGERGPWPGHEPFTLAAEAMAVYEILDRLGTPVHLVGHSYGGALALHVARHRPQCLASLGLIEPCAFHFLRRSAGDSVLFREIAGVAAEVNQAISSGDHLSGMARFVDYWSGEGAWQRMSDQEHVALVPRLAKVALDFRALFEEDTILADFASLDIPTVVIRGTQSPSPSCRIVQMLAGTLPDARIALVENAGHMSPLTHPEAVGKLIAAHLDGAWHSHRAA